MARKYSVAQFRRYLIFRVASVAFGVLVAFSIAECAIRLSFGHLTTLDNALFAVQEGELGSDDMLGSLPRVREVTPRTLYFDASGLVDDEPRATVIAGNIRSNGNEGAIVIPDTIDEDDESYRSPWNLMNTPQRKTPTVLAVGDSFTWGAEVGDRETWPSYAERQLLWRFVNAGVGGYGIDQMVLRAEAIIKRDHPQYCVLAFIPDDIARCELSFREMPKPYFVLDRDGGLALRNSPISEPRPSLGFFRDVFGYSFFLGRILYMIDPNVLSINVRVHDDGPEVCRRLFQHLADVSEREKVTTLIVAIDTVSTNEQKEQSVLATTALADCPLPVLDLSRDLIERTYQAVLEYEGTAIGKLREPRGHYASVGNRIIAEHIVSRLRTLKPTQ